MRQLRSAWADGPAYITQCPIGAGKAYTYKFSVVDQRGTLWWHAHFSWQRASVYGAFIIHPRTPFPFSLPIYPANVPIIFGTYSFLHLFCFSLLYIIVFSLPPFFIFYSISFFSLFTDCIRC